MIGSVNLYSFVLVITMMWKAIKRNKVLEKPLLRSSSPELINTDHNNLSIINGTN